MATKIITNYEHIKSFSKEEFNDFINFLCYDGKCSMCTHAHKPTEKNDFCDDNCDQGFLEWLDEEYKVDIKPCPFCGSEAIICSADVGHFWIKCDGCRAESGSYATESFAIEAWNRREK